MPITSSRSKGLLVRGSINIDEFFNVPHIVRSGETLSSTGYSKRAGGKGANQAVSAAKAGAAVDFAGVIGNDGEWLKDTLTGFGVGIDHLALDSNLPTGRALIQLSSSTADNSIILLPGANFSPLEPSPALSAYSHLLLQNEVPVASTLAACTAAHAAGVHTVWNPSPMPPRDVLAAFPWARLTWLLLNEGEAADLLAVLGGSAKGEGVEGQLAGLAEVGQLVGVGLVVTCGAEGVVAKAGGEVVKAGAGEVKGKVVDTTGAGDCFTGYFATLLAAVTPGRLPSAAELQDVLAVACQAAAICVEAEGAMESVPLLGQVRERMAGGWPEGEVWAELGK